MQYVSREGFATNSAPNGVGSTTIAERESDQRATRRLLGHSKCANELCNLSGHTAALGIRPTARNFDYVVQQRYFECVNVLQLVMYPS
jgi:hypothetical protein